MEKNCNSCKKGIFTVCDVLKKNEDYKNLFDKSFMERLGKELAFKKGFVCEEYQCMYIQYPIEVSKINHPESFRFETSKTGKLVKIKPCAEEYKGKTFLGLYIGDLPIGMHITHGEEKELNLSHSTNPAIFVFELNKIVYGMESYWGVIKTPEDLKDISDEDINNTWYVQLLKSTLESTEEE